VQVAEREAFASLPDGQPAESIGAVYPALIRQRPGSVRAVPVDASFADIGTPAEYLATCLAFAGAAEAERVSLPSPLAGARSTVAPSARVVRTVLWDDVTIGDEASLVECVVTDGVRVPPGIRWRRRAIVPASCCAARPGDELVGDLLLTRIDMEH